MLTTKGPQRLRASLQSRHTLTTTAEPTLEDPPIPDAHIDPAIMGAALRRMLIHSGALVPKAERTDPSPTPSCVDLLPYLPLHP